MAAHGQSPQNAGAGNLESSTCAPRPAAVAATSADNANGTDQQAAAPHLQAELDVTHRELTRTIHGLEETP
jgi:hypothetical protein